MRALVWWPALNARQMFLKAQCVTLAGISRDVMEERADRRMFLVKVVYVYVRCTQQGSAAQTDSDEEVEITNFM